MPALSLRGFGRLLLVALMAVSVQRVVFASFSVFDAKLQFVLALVAAAGAAAGSDTGAVAGFVLGVLVDLTGNTPIGQVALAYGLAGMAAGYLHTFTQEPQWWWTALFAGFGAAVGEAAIPVIDVISANGDVVDTSLPTHVPVVAVAAMILAPALAPVGRWMMSVKRRKWKAIPE